MNEDAENRAQGLFRRLPHDGARTELLTLYRPVANRLARQYSHRGIEREDLEQVAAIGLLNAIDRYDPERGSAFLSFAVPTITGELKRHFRDAGWRVRVPRSMKDLNVASRQASETLTQVLGRTPRIDELAEAIDADPGDVAEAAAMWTAFQPDALDAPCTEDGVTRGDRLGRCDPMFDLATDRHTLSPLLGARPERERRALYLRFYADYTQREIARELGVSQMQVSRILSSALDKLRIMMTV